MAISASDPYYRAEVVPDSIRAMRQPLCAAYGVGASAFGDKGNLAHASGYHRSRNWVLNSRDSRYGSRDYSVTQTLDKAGDKNWVRAFDFTPGNWGTAENRRSMIEITGRVRAAALRRDPRLKDLREFAGTIDGRNVITFNCSDGSTKSPFDSSHLDHCHGSFWTAYAANDHSGVLAVMLGQPSILEADDMPVVAHDANTDTYYVCDLITSRRVPVEDGPNVLTDVLYLAQQLGYGHGAEGVEWSHGGWCREGWSASVFGAVIDVKDGKVVTGQPGQATDLPALFTGGKVEVSGMLDVAPAAD